ncbi:MAG: hypothetical protein H7Y60_06750 [Rhodospirillaceae bacterium]|nr:hypothetical protein [Rhodospirillales bacterium]
MIVRPASTTALAKAVVKGLSQKGPYKGKLQTGYFDTIAKIPTTSIVSYGLKPLVKLDGNDSLYSTWARKDELRNRDGSVNMALIDEYVAYCVETINEFLLQAMQACGTEGWSLTSPNRSPLLSLTPVNGLISCLRKVISAGHVLSPELHKEAMARLKLVAIGEYKSSHWQKLGLEIFSVCYGPIPVQAAERAAE